MSRYGLTACWQLADFVEAKVEAKHEQVQSNAYSDVYKELSAKPIFESAKQIARDEVSPSMDESKQHW